MGGNYIPATWDGKTIGKQTDDSAVVSSEIKVNTGRAKGIGTSPTLLTTVALNNSQDYMYGSTVVSGAGGEVNPAYMGAGFTFAYTVGDVIRKVATGINGVYNDALRHGGSDYGWRKANNQAVSVRSYLVASAIRNGYWHSYSGIWTTDPTAQDDFTTIVAQSGDGASMGLDEAANPSGAVPGELVYRDGSDEPTQANYPARTLW